MSNQQKTFWESIWKTDSKEGIWTHELWKEVSPEIVSLIQSQSPDERPDVLDLGCGLGRNSIAFAQAGFNVTGVDLSSSAIIHTRDWANKLGLRIQTLISDFDRVAFQPDTFDIVISVNVIYHGYFRQALSTINNIRTYLKTGGLLCFTFPSKKDGEYGHGKKLEEHTFEFQPGHIHCHVDEHELNNLLKDFKVLYLDKRERPWMNDQSRLFSRWHVIAEKI